MLIDILLERARHVYERAIDFLGTEYLDEKVLMAFARFEIRCKEHERARVIFKFAIQTLSKDKVPELYRLYVGFEKQHGNRDAVEEALIEKRRVQYEEVRRLLV